MSLAKNLYELSNKLLDQIAATKTYVDKKEALLRAMIRMRDCLMRPWLDKMIIQTEANMKNEQVGYQLILMRAAVEPPKTAFNINNALYTAMYKTRFSITYGFESKAVHEGNVMRRLKDGNYKDGRPWKISSIPLKVVNPPDADKGDSYFHSDEKHPLPSVFKTKAQAGINDLN